MDQFKPTDQDVMDWLQRIIEDRAADLTAGSESLALKAKQDLARYYAGLIKPEDEDGIPF